MNAIGGYEALRRSLREVWSEADRKDAATVFDALHDLGFDVTPAPELARPVDPPKGRANSTYVRRSCSIEGCDKRTQQKGLCSTHLSWLRRTGDATTSGLRSELAELLWTKFRRDPETGCWEWLGSMNRNGYGQAASTAIGPAHRQVWQLLVGPIPEGLHLDHLCRNKGCVNPSHLEPVTPAENTRRSPFYRGNWTHCHRGHEFTPDNTYVTTDGRRQCKECRRAGLRRRYAEKKAAAKRGEIAS